MGALTLTDKQHYPQICTTQPKPMRHHVMALYMSVDSAIQVRRHKYMEFNNDMKRANQILHIQSQTKIKNIDISAVFDEIWR